MKYPPKTLVTVFGKYPGIVVAPGKVLPAKPDDWTRVEYRDTHTGMRVSSWVENINITERK